MVNVRSLLAVAMAMAMAAILAGCVEEPPTDAACPFSECGVSCFDPDVCGSCGNAVCDWHEGIDTCHADCCDPDLCEPSGGPRHAAGDATCTGAPDGTRCDDDDLDNGVETCRGGSCRREHPHCRCMPPGGAFASTDEVEMDSSELLPPPIPDHPPWSGAEPTEESFARAWGLRRIDTSRAWEVTRGDPELLLGIVDTGCDENNADISGRVVAQRDFVDRDREPGDDGGHGTFLASVAAGAEDGDGVVGVAPGVRMVCARVIDGESDDARTEYSLVADGIDWAVEQGAKVVLVGLGGRVSTDGLKSAIDRALDADVLIVAPSGSDGGGNEDLFPAAYSGVLSVAASSRADLPDLGTELSPKTDLLAPGVDIVGTGRAGVGNHNSGSSVAAALAAGTAALVRSAQPGLSAAQVSALLHGSAAPVPMENFDRIFRARRLDAGAALAAATPDRADVAVESVYLGTESWLPGAPVVGLVRVENRGALEAQSVSLSVSGDGGDAFFPDGEGSRMVIDSLAVGERVEVRVALMPDDGADGVGIQVSAELAGDSDSDNDSASANATIGTEIVHRLVVEGIGQEQAAAGGERTVHASVLNAGNVPEPASELRVALLPTGQLSTLEVPALEPGESARVETSVELSDEALTDRFQVVFYQRPARGQDQTDAAVAWLNVSSPHFNEGVGTAYMQLKGHTFITDAPWRTTRDRLPLLVFYARTQWLSTQAPFGADILEVVLPGTSPPGAARPLRVSVYNPTEPSLDDTSRLIYQDKRAGIDGTRNAKPTRAPLGLHVTDEAGQGVESRKLLIGSPEQGAHRIAWLHVADLERAPDCNDTPCPDRRPDPHAEGAFVSTKIDWNISQGRGDVRFPGRTRKMMFVALSDDDLPSFSKLDRYYDPHFHSVAEWWPGTYLTGPAKAYGGPLEMLFASAWSVGLIDTDRDAIGLESNKSTHLIARQARDRVITTDHNTFFDDSYAPAGPGSMDKWKYAEVSDKNDNRGYPTFGTGSPEFDLFRDVVGRTAGEEISLQPKAVTEGQDNAAELRLQAAMGHHALLYDSQFHVNGVWGTLDTRSCTPTIEEYLKRLAGGPDGTGSTTMCGNPDKGLDPKLQTLGMGVRRLGGFEGTDFKPFTYAAHPFANMFRWGRLRDGFYDDNVARHAASIPLRSDGSASSYNDREFATARENAASPDTRGDGEFVFRGYQFWNWRTAQHINPGFEDPLVPRELNPYKREVVGAANTDDPVYTLGPWEPACGVDARVDTEHYRGGVLDHLNVWLDQVRDGMHFRFLDEEIVDKPAKQFIRKIYAIAGSDAHGDFNWHSDFCGTRASQICQALGMADYFDGGFARSRTYVMAPFESDEHAGLNDLRQGRAIMTDGPIIDLQVDSESRGSTDVEGVGGGRSCDTGVCWDDRTLVHHDPEGRMGGEGVRDGGGTVLLPYVPEQEQQRPSVRTRCLNIGDFAGGKGPTTIELIHSGQAGTRDDAGRIELSTAESSCGGEWLNEIVDLGVLKEPIAVLAHVEYDHGCPAVYDAYTNPVWIAPVHTIVPLLAGYESDDTLHIRTLSEQRGDPETHDIDLHFPISMSPDEVEAQIFHVNPDNGRLVLLEGGHDEGEGRLMPIERGEDGEEVKNGWRHHKADRSKPDDESPLVEFNRLSLRIVNPIIGERREGLAIDETFVLVVKRKGEDPRLRDVFGNPLHTYMARFHPHCVPQDLGPPEEAIETGGSRGPAGGEIGSVCGNEVRWGRYSVTNTTEEPLEFVGWIDPVNDELPLECPNDEPDCARWSFKMWQGPDCSEEKPGAEPFLHDRTGDGMVDSWALRWVIPPGQTDEVCTSFTHTGEYKFLPYGWRPLIFGSSQ